MKRHVCFRITQSRPFLSTVYIEGIRDEGARNSVRNNESSRVRYTERIYIQFISQNPKNRNFSSYSGKFVVRGARYRPVSETSQTGP